MNIRQHNHFTMKHYIFLMICMATSLQAQEDNDGSYDDAIGLDIMNEVYKRHQQFTFIYEEQSMVMMDRNGDRDMRKVRRYSRVEDDGSVKFLLLFDSPNEINGVALLANRDASGNTNKHIYLPGFGEQLIENVSSGRDGNFLGTDFSIENLVGEALEEYIYVRKADKKINDTEFFVIDAYRREDIINEAMLSEQNQVNRRHFISKNNFFITRTEYCNKQGKVFKTQSHHDLKPVDGKMWRANMILMEDSKENHQSLIKINSRVFSRDYVPAEIFTADWLFKNSPYISLPDTDIEGAEDIIDEQNNVSTNSDTVIIQ